VGLITFYLNVVGAAVTASLDITQAVIFVLAITIGLVGRFVPSLRGAVDLSSWQVGLCVLAVIVGTRLIAAPYWIWDAERQELVAAGKEISSLSAKLDDRERKKAIRSQLGVFLDQGQQLMVRCADESQPPPNADADEWAAKTETYLTAQLDPSFVARFRNGTGLPLTANSIASIPHRNLWAGLWVSMSRIQQFIQELGSWA
jgi:hypothetical protein